MESLLGWARRIIKNGRTVNNLSTEHVKWHLFETCCGNNFSLIWHFCTSYNNAKYDIEIALPVGDHLQLLVRILCLGIKWALDSFC